MRTLLILMLVCALYGAHQGWQKQDAARAAASDASTFVAVEMPGGVQRNTVLVLAPTNCPSEQAQRTQALIRDLERAGIPVVRDSGFAFDVENPTDALMQGIDRAVAVLKRGAPAVFVNDMAMSNPSVEQTIAVYRGSGGRR